jgi:toluene monooxygenase system protein D
MSQEQANLYDHVGPVLQVGVLSEAIVAAIRDLNRDVEVIDRGGYLRVLVPHRCIVTRSAIEKYLGRSVPR